jgi:hypothetical protein
MQALQLPMYADMFKYQGLPEKNLNTALAGSKETKL